MLCPCTAFQTAEALTNSEVNTLLTHYIEIKRKADPNYQVQLRFWRSLAARIDNTHLGLNLLRHSAVFLSANELLAWQVHPMTKLAQAYAERFSNTKNRDTIVQMRE